MRSYYNKNKEKLIEANYRRKYGLTSEDFLKMLKEQNYGCAVCAEKIGEAKRKRRLFIDHCHKTGMARGVLCGNCNTAIGMLKDSAELLLKARLYILRHTGQT